MQAFIFIMAHGAAVHALSAFSMLQLAPLNRRAVLHLLSSHSPWLDHELDNLVSLEKLLLYNDRISDAASPLHTCIVQEPACHTAAQRFP